MISLSDVIPDLDDLTIFNDCDALMRHVKEKLDKCHTREEIIQLLTLIPEHLSRERAISFFSVTDTWLEMQEMSKERKLY